MNDSVLNEWEDWGVTLDNIIVSPEERKRISIFKSASSTNSRFSPRDFEIQKQILYQF